MATNIHPSAIVAKSAQLGVDVVVGPYAVIEENTVIGDGCKLDSFCLVHSYTEMGSNNHIYPHAVLGGEPQHMAYNGEDTKLVIGDNNQFREGMTIHRGTIQGEGQTTVGSDCMFMGASHVAHDCLISDNVILANAVLLAGHVSIGNNVIISGMAAVQQFLKIGDYAFLGGSSGYNLDIPPYMLAHGVRGRLYGPNLIGLRRHGFSSEACKALKKAYKVLFRSNLRKNDAISQVEQDMGEHPEIMHLLQFMKDSKQVAPDGTYKSNGCQE